MRSALIRFSSALGFMLLFSFTLLAQDNTKQQKPSVDKNKNPQFEASAQLLTDNLASKIMLNDEQKIDIKDAIYKYHAVTLHNTENEANTPNETNETGKESDKNVVREKESNAGNETQMSAETRDMDQWLNQEIESILVDNQRPQWEVAKADFWNQLRDKVSSFQKNQNGLY